MNIVRKKFDILKFILYMVLGMAIMVFTAFLYSL